MGDMWNKQLKHQMDEMAEKGNTCVGVTAFVDHYQKHSADLKSEAAKTSGNATTNFADTMDLQVLRNSVYRRVAVNDVLVLPQVPKIISDLCTGKIAVKA